MKSYSVRFYAGQAGADGNAKKVSEIFGDLIQKQAQGEQLPQMIEGGKIYELRDFLGFNNGASFRGVLAVLRDDAPHIRAADGAERAIELEQDEHIIEKNHFLFFRANELLIWQVNGHASHISRFERYLTACAPETITFNDVINKSSLERLEQGTVKRLRVRVAKPKNAAAIDPNNWESGAFELMNGIDGTMLQVEISTRRKNQGLSANVKSAIHRFLDRAETRALEVKLDGEKDLIDLFADCMRERIEVEMNGLYPLADSIYAALQGAKDKQSEALNAYFGAGNAVLE